MCGVILSACLGHGDELIYHHLRQQRRALSQKEIHYGVDTVIT